MLGLSLSEAELRSCAEVFCGEVACEIPGPPRGGDHHGVISGEGKRGKGNRKAATVCFGLKAAAKLSIGGDSAGDNNAQCAERLCCCEGLADEVADDGVLEGGDEVEGLPITERDDLLRCWLDAALCCQSGTTSLDRLSHAVGFGETENGGFNTAEGEIEGRGTAGFCGSFFVCNAFAYGTRSDLAEGEGYSVRVAMEGKRVDPGTTGVAEAEQLGNLIEGFPGSIIDSTADALIAPGRLYCSRRQIEMRVAAGNNEREER